MQDTNPMVYRVFLKEHQAPENPESPESPERVSLFTISYGEMLAWTYQTRDYSPSLENQLSRMHHCIDFSSRKFDGHYLIERESQLLGIVHSPEEIKDRAEGFARTQASDLVINLLINKGKPYVFIDLTSKGDRESAEELSKKIYDEEVYVPSRTTPDMDF